MKKLGLHEIRREFLSFFESKNHLIKPSYSLVPQDDKSLLLIGAGMAPLKKYFTGEEKPENKRMTSCQKCIRTGDIENVGITDRHGTFFEMLGNFSFGDYFKKESIEWAWEFLTINLELNKDDLWVTVYLEDDEAEKIWLEDIGVPKDRIVRLGKEDNFWELEVGPSGPCSEIYVDRGIDFGCKEKTCKPGCDCDRFLEIWNLVFTQFDKDSSGNYNPLPNPNIDTGMGLERIAAYLEGVQSIFEIKAIRGILSKVEEIAGKTYGNDSQDDISMRIITDHARAMTFLVSDKVYPSNEARGYILRRLIRRAARHGKLLGIEGSFLGQIVDEVINSWKVEYTDLDTNRKKIKEVIKIEEEKFQETIDYGLSRLEKLIEDMEVNNKKTLSGYEAFKLYDTYGFPLDLTREILEEKDFGVDIDGFNKHMEEQREKARAARNIGESGWSTEENTEVYGDLKTEFKGYENLDMESSIEGVFIDGEKIDILSEDQKGIVILKETPFYPEGGGQIYDKGEIYSKDSRGEVLNTQKTKEGHILHLIKVIHGSFKTEDLVRVSVFKDRRELIKRNHTSTHLLHQALKNILGNDVNQAGSSVESERLRFDFTYPKKLTEIELKDIEEEVNKKIFDSLDIKVINTNLKEAKELGAVGLFEDKYGDRVRVLKIGDYSVELCGGTHVKNTSEIGIFKIISESSVSSGIRRIEAITSRAVYQYLNSMETLIDEVSYELSSNKNNILDRINVLKEESHKQKQELEKVKLELANQTSKDLLVGVESVNGINFLARKLENMGMNDLRNLSDELKGSLESAVIVLAGIQKEKLFFVVAVTEDLVGKGIHAGKMIKDIAGVTGGSGGGRANMAQAGGKDLDKVDEALVKAKTILKEQLK